MTIISQNSQPVADESIKVSAEPAWQICVFLSTIQHPDQLPFPSFLGMISMAS